MNDLEETVICTWCGEEVKKKDAIIHPLLYILNDYIYCSVECAEAHFETK